MRIVAGHLRGRRIVAPRGSKVRPTSDRVREALGSILQSRGLIQEAFILDLFAGSGAISFELLSRGAKFSWMVEQDRNVIKVIEENARLLDVDSQSRCIALDLFGKPSAVAEKLCQIITHPVDLVFADPPYAHAGECLGLFEAIHDSPLVAAHTLAIVEHSDKLDLLGFEVEQRYSYGSTRLSLARANKASP